MRKKILKFAVLVSFMSAGSAVYAQAPSPRLALVIGEAQYREAPLATAANDGGLMADMLRQAGFDVTGAANLSQDQIRQTFREFLEKVAAVGPQAQVFVYLSGKGLQFAGDNYLAPIESTIANSASVPAEAVRLSDFIGPLQQMPAQGRVIVLDLARPNEFGRSGQPIAGGLALVDAPDGTLVAFNASPGTIAPNEQGSYGAYAQALVEMLRQPGLPINDAFSQIRLRVNETTRGAETPWDVTHLSGALTMFQPAPNAPPRAPTPRRVYQRGALRGLPPAEAYGMAVETDSFDGYNEFISDYPGDPLARRVRAMLAARREALTWFRAVRANTPQAYWTYLQRYPRGPHSPDAERRLAFISAPLAPPPQFAVYDYDVPPPPPDEIVIIDRPRFYMNEVVDVPPPPMPLGFLPPIAPEYRELPPPPPPPRMGFLPIPIPIPIPFARPMPQQGFVNAPRFVQQPVAQPGAPAGAQPLPQGYSPAPAGQGRPPGAPAGGGFAPVPGAPGGAGTALPGTAPPRPVGTPLPGGAPTQTGAPTSPAAPATPSQALPRPGQNGAPTAPAGAGTRPLDPNGNPVSPGGTRPQTPGMGGSEPVGGNGLRPGSGGLPPAPSGASPPSSQPAPTGSAPKPTAAPEPKAPAPQSLPAPTGPKPGSAAPTMAPKPDPARPTPAPAPMAPSAPVAPHVNAPVAPPHVTAPPPVPHVAAPPPVPHVAAPPPVPHVSAPPPVPHVAAPPPMPHMAAPPPPAPHISAPPPIPHVAAPPPPPAAVPHPPAAMHPPVAPGGAPHAPGEK